ncbi:hypothetical protein QFZ63_001568 [Streptomyces sp. B3I7]|uniref:hypothetical protein n=1 Tax=Streptomyces sp. B3I7 TaxID=3042269 RepID=UPI00278A71C2|nr:hypothetical protein [Streptomyces sp. B3I7]MDQ0809854.1 hypothetical protein [Streptomyces sp. B3I7]
MPKFEFTAFTSAGKRAGHTEAANVDEAVLNVDDAAKKAGDGECKRVVIDGVTHSPLMTRWHR